MEPQFVRLDEVRAFELAAGVSGRPLFGEGAMLNLIRFEPGAIVPLHSHPHEQLGMVLRGAMTFRIGDETRELGPGETWTIPSNVPHEATAGPEGAVVIDVFAPVREDWVALEPADPREPRWP